MNSDYDTTLTVPGAQGAASFMIRLRLDVPEPDLTGLDDLLEDRALDELERVLNQVDQPYPWATEHVLHALDHLRRREYRHAWPPLVIGVEGL